MEIRQDAITGLVLDHPVSLSVKIKNPNDSDVSLKGTTLAVSGVVDKAHENCVFFQNSTVNTPIVMADRIYGNGVLTADKGSITLNNSEDANQVACQGATVMLSYVLK